MAKKEKKKLERKNWSNSFILKGAAIISDFTYKIDEKAEKSDWIYNSLNLDINCGEICGTVKSELMGGYGSERDNVIYVHGKKDDGTDDYENRFEIDWDDRFDEDILESIGDNCFFTAGLEKDKDEKIVYKKFLSPYDFINYVKETLTDGAVVNVKGNTKFSKYNDELQTKKEIKSIVLSKSERKDFRATFIQTMLLTKDSIGKPDKTKGILPIYGKVLEYAKEINGKIVKGQVPYEKAFEYELDFEDKEKTEKVIAKLFKVRKGVTEITFEGEFIEGGAAVTVTEDDIPDDIKELIDIGVFTLEEALTKCSTNNKKERRMVIRKPFIKKIGSEDNKVATIQKFDNKYDEEDLILDCMIETENTDGDDIETHNIDVDDKEDTKINDIINDLDNDDWLNNI